MEKGMNTTMPPEKQVYDVYNYELWSDGNSGKMVNDVFYSHQITLRVKPTTYNIGTAHEFTDYSPTDLQLSRAVGLRGGTWGGESEHILYATDAKGDPCCELRRRKE